MIQFALTHLSELVVDQLQPGNVQVIQVIAAVALGGRRLGVALPLLPVVGQTACWLWQQPGTQRYTQRLYHVVWKHNTKTCFNRLETPKIESKYNVLLNSLMGHNSSTWLTNSLSNSIQHGVMWSLAPEGCGCVTAHCQHLSQYSTTSSMFLHNATFTIFTDAPNIKVRTEAINRFILAVPAVLCWSSVL